jgi:type VI secretion system VasD/TssJ family lipoprotein
VKASFHETVVTRWSMLPKKPEIGKWWVPVTLMVIAVAFTACSTPPDPVPSWGFGPGGIKINYAADKNLNAIRDRPHALLLTVYQLTDPNAFNKLAQNQAGLKKLLEGQDVDPTVTAVRKLSVGPGESSALEMDRAEKTKWIGVVAGYYSLDPSKVSKTFEIPYKVETHGFISKKKVATVPIFELHLVLGPQSLQEKKPQ